MVNSMKKIVAISTIVAVTMMLTMGYLVPQIAATDNSSHKKPLYLDVTDPPCSASVDKFCTVIVDTNRDGVCDADEPRVQMPARIAETLPPCAAY